MNSVCSICSQGATHDSPLFGPCLCPKVYHNACWMHEHPRTSYDEYRCTKCDELVAIVSPLDSQSEIQWGHYSAYARHAIRGYGLPMSEWAMLIFVASVFLAVIILVSYVLNLVEIWVKTAWKVLETPDYRPPNKEWTYLLDFYRGVKYLPIALAFGPIISQVWCAQSQQLEQLTAQREQTQQEKALQEKAQQEKPGGGLDVATEKGMEKDPLLARLVAIDADSQQGVLVWMVEKWLNPSLIASAGALITCPFIVIMFFCLYDVCQLIVQRLYAMLSPFLVSVNSSWAFVASEVFSWNMQTDPEKMVLSALLALTLALFFAHKILRRLDRSASNRPYVSATIRTTLLVYPVVAVAMLLPYLHGVVLAAVATGEWRWAGPDPLVGWLVWLVGALSWLEHRCRNGGTKDFIGQPELRNYANLVLVFLDLTCRNALVVYVFRLAWVGMDLPSFTLSLSSSHVPFYALFLVALGMRSGQPLVYLVSLLGSLGIEDKHGASNWVKRKLLLLLRTFSIGVLGVLPFWVGRQCTALPNDLLVWMGFFTVEIHLFGLLLPECCTPPVIRSRSLLASLAFLVVLLPVHFTSSTWQAPKWILADVAFRLLAIIWPDRGYTYIVFPFMLLNIRGVHDLGQMGALLAVSDEWRIVLGWFRAFVRKTYPRALANYAEAYEV